MVATLLGIGWAAIAGARIFGRKIAVALAAWSAAAGLYFVLGFGGRVQMCLGPLDVTEASCRLALGRPPETELDRFLAGPGPLILALVAGWLAIVLATSWTRARRSATESRSGNG